MKIGRYTPSDLSLNRIMLALKTRLDEIPHSISWNTGDQSRVNRNRLIKYHNIHAGKRCFIVANGPSLTRMNLDLLRNEITFGMNRIYLHFANSNFRPKYYLTVNELILEQYAMDISKLEMPKFLNWNRRSYFNLSDSSINFIKSRMVLNDSFEGDITKPVVVGGTVTFVALQLAYYMGFSQAILIGLDHSYVEKGVPSATVTRKETRDQSHFHPDYFPKGSKWQLPDLLRSEIDYHLAKEYYKSNGREILDATPEGKCPVFDRVEYQSLFH
jgi:hypothetical protein